MPRRRWTGSWSSSLPTGSPTPVSCCAACARGGAQTPQGFRVALRRRAYDKAFRDDVVLTDEAMALERLGEPVVAVKGSARNRKLTTPEDLAWAETLLLSEGRQ